MNTIQSEMSGTLTPEGTLVLDEKPNMAPGRVYVTLRSKEAVVPSETALQDLFARLDRERQARGIPARAREDIDAEIQALRSEPEYEERCRRLGSGA